MANCPLYNGQNLDFTGKSNPYGLIQNAGKKKSRKCKKSRTCKKCKKSRTCKKCKKSRTCKKI
jgi:hypothetical protein